MNCRHCKTPLSLPFLDLGAAPPSNAYLTRDGLTKREIHYPLKVMTCDQCWLVQTEDTADACVDNINIIPHTLENTTLGQLKQGDAVNLEVDLIARYVARMMEAQVK
jgi:hypothetical protein